MEMILEAGPFGIQVPAVPQGKHGTDQLHGVPQGTGIRKGAVVSGPVLQHPPGEHHPGIGFLHRDFQVRIGLVIFQVDVIPGPVFLNQVALQDQCFHLAGGDNGLDGSHMGVDGPYLGGHLTGRAEIAPHPVLQDHCLAHIDDLALSIMHDIDPRRIGQDGQGLLDGFVHDRTFFTY